MGQVMMLWAVCVSALGPSGQLFICETKLNWIVWVPVLSCTTEQAQQDGRVQCTAYVIEFEITICFSFLCSS